MKSSLGKELFYFTKGRYFNYTQIQKISESGTLGDWID